MRSIRAFTLGLAVPPPSAGPIRHVVVMGAAVSLFVMDAHSERSKITIVTPASEPEPRDTDLFNQLIIQLPLALPPTTIKPQSSIKWSINRE